MSEQKTAEQRMRAYFKPVPMVDAERLPDPDLLSPGDLRARIEQLQPRNNGDFSSREFDRVCDGFAMAKESVLALLGAAQEQP